MAKLKKRLVDDSLSIIPVSSNPIVAPNLFSVLASVFVCPSSNPVECTFFFWFFEGLFFLPSSIPVTNMSFCLCYMVSARESFNQEVIHLNASYSSLYCRARVLKGLETPKSAQVCGL